MSDPAIKLFGKTIQLDPHPDQSDSQDQYLLSSSDCSVSLNKNAATEGAAESKPEEGSSTLRDQAFPQTPSQSKEHSSSDQEEQSDGAKSHEKTLKKPDRVLPCPRCNSLDTKFCYFNNYNLNQPRHFCKNCQRYWTAGGAIRNVPVGAGRRKNKHRHEPLLCDSIASALTTADNSSHPAFNSSIPAPPPFFLGFPFPIYAASPYWNSASWTPPPASSSTNSPLGKHSREETKVLVPKTLRIDDPSEAAKSSIWTTLGIKKEKAGCLDSGVFFRGVQSKSNRMRSEAENSSVLQANPAALSRFLTYHESAA